MQSINEVPKVAIFASGNGTTFEAIHQATQGGVLEGAQIGLVIANNSHAKVLDRARLHGIAAHFIPHDEHEHIQRTLEEGEVDIIALAGYLRLLGAVTVETYEGRILNSHPGPLPAFGGKGMYKRHVHEVVLKSGTRWSGPTVHMVTAQYDEGAVIAHAPVRVSSSDTPETLAERVSLAEGKLYPVAIAGLISRLRQPDIYFRDV